MQISSFTAIILKISQWLNWPNTRHKLIYFVLLQLFITAISLPILIWWGLPISVATPIGNLLFGPILTLFLFLASLIFFTELVHLPNQIFIWALERVSEVWHWLAELGSKSYLISFSKPPVWFIVLLPIAAFLIIQSKYTHPPLRSIICFSVAILVYSFALKAWYGPRPTIDTMPCNGKEIHLLRTHKEIILIDPGVIGSRISAVSWASYNFLQELSQRYGTQTIDHCIVLQPGAVTFEALTAICAKAKVKKLYLVLWREKLPYGAWRNYKALMEECKKQNTKVIRIGSRPISITYTDDTFITIEPLEEEIAYQDARYNALHVSGLIDNQPISFYSAKSRTPSNTTIIS